MCAAPLIVLTAGGTGGHLFPAEALASALRERGVRVVLATDNRVGTLASGFPADEIIEIPSASPSNGSVLKKINAAIQLGIGTLKARSVLRRLKPVAVVGFGGYPTVPPVLAAGMLGIPAIIHEQNVVMGRANRLLSRRAAMIATGFPNVSAVPASAKGRRVHTGNPIRPMVREAAAVPYPSLGPDDKFRILIFGGSQGARIMSVIAPDAMAMIPAAQRERLYLVQQARAEDLDQVRGHYKALELDSEVEPFFKDLPRRMADSHMVISRSGASTVAELSAIGRPSILVPLPGSLDQDQAANAKVLADIDAATVILQKDFTPARLAREIMDRLESPEDLTAAAKAAKSAGILDAADRLAQAILDFVAGKSPEGTVNYKASA